MKAAAKHAVVATLTPTVEAASSCSQAMGAVGSLPLRRESSSPSLAALPCSTGAVASSQRPCPVAPLTAAMVVCGELCHDSAAAVLRRVHRLSIAKESARAADRAAESAWPVHLLGCERLGRGTVHKLSMLPNADPARSPAVGCSRCTRSAKLAIAPRPANAARKVGQSTFYRHAGTYCFGLEISFSCGRFTLRVRLPPVVIKS